MVGGQVGVLLSARPEMTFCPISSVCLALLFPLVETVSAVRRCLLYQQHAEAQTLVYVEDEVVRFDSFNEYAITLIFC